MVSDYSLYKYFRGEDSNPFDQVKANNQYQFWGYEQLFEMDFSKGDFSPDLWVIPYATDINQWKAILSQKPVDKEELFKIWLYRLLMEHLPEKYQSNDESEFLKLYFGKINPKLDLGSKSLNQN